MGEKSPFQKGWSKLNQDIIAKQCIQNDDLVLVVSDEDKEIVWKSYHEKLLNTEFAYDKNSAAKANAVIGVNRLVHW